MITTRAPDGAKNSKNGSGIRVDPPPLFFLKFPHFPVFFLGSVPYTEDVKIICPKFLAKCQNCVLSSKMSKEVCILQRKYRLQTMIKHCKLEKSKNFSGKYDLAGSEFKIWLRLAKFLIFFTNYPPPDHNLGQILNSDPARSYFPFNTPTCT